MADELRSYLESLLSSAIEGNHVIPPDAASEKISSEIEHRTKLKAQNLAERNVETIERQITAAPTGFVEQALQAVADVSQTLLNKRASAFEAKFANPAHDPKWDFGRVKLLVRFVTDQRIVRNFVVRAFKSIESADVDLGCVNVFIG